MAEKMLDIAGELLEVLQEREMADAGLDQEAGARNVIGHGERVLALDRGLLPDDCVYRRSNFGSPCLTNGRIDAADEAIIFETLKQRKKQMYRAVPAIYASAIGDEERNLAHRAWRSLELAIPEAAEHRLRTW